MWIVTCSSNLWLVLLLEGGRDSIPIVPDIVQRNSKIPVEFIGWCDGEIQSEDDIFDLEQRAR